MKKFAPILMLLIGCSAPIKKEEKAQTETTIIETINPTSKDIPIVYVDSTSFGNAGHSKIEIIKYYKVNQGQLEEDSCFSIIKLYAKTNSKWILTDEKKLANTALSDLDPKMLDMNNDGFKDVLYTSAVAARGANLLQTLVLFEPKKEKLIWVKNSEHYPNLEYNQKLNCIDALAFSGGLTTEFLKIQGDSLIIFAEVDQREGKISVYKFDSKGNFKKVKEIEDKGFSDFARFSNFEPIEE